MIRGFSCPETAKIFSGRPVRRWPADLQRAARRKLLMLDGASNVMQLAVPPANRLKKLEGRGDWWSIRVNDQWRIIFHWQSGEATEVALVDYH